MVPPEDLVISKMAWIQQLQSEKQMNDIRDLLQLPGIDMNYINKWCSELSLQTFNLLQWSTPPPHTLNPSPSALCTSLSALRLPAIIFTESLCQTPDSMNDTPPDILNKQREIMRTKSPAERLRLSEDLYTLALQNMMHGINEQHPGLDETGKLKIVLTRKYAKYFSKEEWEVVLNRYGKYLLESVISNRYH